jgi:hypothetical protein
MAKMEGTLTTINEPLETGPIPYVCSMVGVTPGSTVLATSVHHETEHNNSPLMRNEDGAVKGTSESMLSTATFTVSWAMLTQ